MTRKNEILDTSIAHLTPNQEMVGAARFRNNRSRGQRTSRGLWASQEDPERDLQELPDDVKRVLKNKMRNTDHAGSTGGSVHIHRIIDATGKIRTIIDF